MLQVLLDENNKAHVADIGLGKMMAGKDALASTATFFWAAPEQLQVRNFLIFPIIQVAFASFWKMSSSPVL